MAKLGKEGPIAPSQARYNLQAERALDVTDEVLYIDGPSVEKWLADNDKPPQDSYTIYFINWVSHPGFRFHVYTKTDEPDPDTKYNFGINRGSRKMVAWGGTHSRSWFYDFSAGPESWGANFDVANPDIDGDVVPDYRIPVIWEYGNPASPVSRPASAESCGRQQAHCQHPQGGDRQRAPAGGPGPVRRCRGTAPE